MTAVTVAAAMRDGLRVFGVAANVRAAGDRIVVTPRQKPGHGLDTRFGENGQRVVRQAAIMLGLTRPRGMPLYADNPSPDDDRIMMFEIRRRTNRDADGSATDRDLTWRLAWLIAEHGQADPEFWARRATTLFGSLPVQKVAHVADTLRTLLALTEHGEA